ncbi:MAG TPA: hypothetical protein PK587_04505 [Syntrophales bacterium]|nr:hypothetical protein [Syntrophales bacterium]
MDSEFSLSGEREKSRVAERVLSTLKAVFSQSGKAGELSRTSPPAGRKFLDELLKGCDRVFRRSQPSVNGWIPSVLFEKGLFEALSRLSSRIGARSGAKVGIQDCGCPRISNVSLKIILYQMVRAIALGAVQTGSAMLEISLKGDSKYAMVTVRDLTSGAFRKLNYEDTFDSACRELRGRVLRLGGFFHIEQDEEGARKYMLVMPIL